MSVKLSEITGLIEKVAPKNIAENWDNVGLQVGSSRQLIERIVLTLDVTADVVKEAVEKKADLIIAHHPFIFHGLKTLAADNEKGQLITMLIKNDIALYVAHTNLDKAENGLNDFLAQLLGLADRQTLEPSNPENFVKLVVYTPQEATDKIIDAFGKHGAGSIGDYDYCSYRSSGIGTFRPRPGANPYIGEIDAITSVDEDRIEAIVPRNSLKQLLIQLKNSHPYEEMAYDIIPLENGAFINQRGLGKIGWLKKPMRSVDFIDYVKKTLNLKALRAAGKMPATIQRVAVCSGAGADLIGLAKAKKADVLITGDLKYHDGQRAQENNFWVIDAGHFGTEKCVVDCFKQIIQAGLPENCPEILTAASSQDYISNY
ncbi:Nif3-like dinuclear metal center hexameric protein [Acetobacterium fimetarium]|uniref:GTP cyclohydrolase 1 type 2 homolog n=1 Tax=Acetobacterium fimetarium TaxID=52691 RepID=A0ABR6WY48_9FIRM|nr:Nif3-like dinuclear metal center hexameric protein [Acetobacterium fimetarium]MBC3805154.1 Nif3-like dinuclear metal center hexameric protein [Acetobacterium fimetarium]